MTINVISPSSKVWLLECSNGRDPGLKGKDGTLIINVGHGYGHDYGQLMPGAILRPLPAQPAVLHLCHTSWFTRNPTTLASPHSHHKPELGLNRCENWGCALCLRFHSQLTSPPLSLQALSFLLKPLGVPWLPSSRNRQLSHCHPPRSLVTCFTVSSVICMALVP